MSFKFLTLGSLSASRIAVEGTLMGLIKEISDVLDRFLTFFYSKLILCSNKLCHYK